MSAYITPAQIYGKIPQQKVTDACDDSGSGNAVQIENTLNQIIADACQVVDGFLQGRYPVPFSGTIPAIVVQASLAFACEAIYGRRQVGEEANPFTRQANVYRGSSTAAGLLTKIANRELPLDVAEVESIIPGAVIQEEAPVNASFR
jgi:phage gp36-like protein